MYMKPQVLNNFSSHFFQTSLSEEAEVCSSENLQLIRASCRSQVSWLSCDLRAAAAYWYISIPVILIIVCRRWKSLVPSRTTLDQGRWYYPSTTQLFCQGELCTLVTLITVLATSQTRQRKRSSFQKLRWNTGQVTVNYMTTLYFMYTFHPHTGFFWGHSSLYRDQKNFSGMCFQLYSHILWL